MNCRRCQSSGLIRLDKKQATDNFVYRCQDCGFLFSPQEPEASPEASTNASRGVNAGFDDAQPRGVSRTTAFRSGFLGLL